MIKLWKRIPRAWHLGLCLALCLVLLCLGWLLQGCPMFSREAAFRRGLGNDLTEPAPAELYVLRRPYLEDSSEPDSFLALTRTGGRACTMTVWKSGAAWNSSDFREYAPLEGVWLVPLRVDDWDDFATLSAAGDQPAAAVQWPGAARLELELVLEDQPEGYPGGSYPLVSLGEQAGWQLFTFDLEPLVTVITNSNGEEQRTIDERDIRARRDPALYGYWDWILRYYQGRLYQPDQPSFFRLSAWNAQGELLGTRILYPEG